MLHMLFVGVVLARDDVPQKNVQIPSNDLMEQKQKTSIETLAQWAKPREDLGRGVYQLTTGPQDHRHAYYTICAWSEDQSKLLLLRHDRENPDAEVCILHTSTGEIEVIGDTNRWNPHTAARQQWQGNTGRVLYETRDDNGLRTIVSVFPDGAEPRLIPSPDVEFWKSSPDGTFVFGATARGKLFARDDSIEPRHDKGVVSVDLQTGETKLVFSLEQALALHPQREKITAYHLYPKALIVHPTRKRLLFNLVNGPWDMAGREERIRGIFTVGFNGSEPAYLGEIIHHPNWDPSSDRIVVNVRDINNTLRFGLYRGDGGGLLEYVPGTEGTGHPSMSPCGRWICSDSRRLPENRNGLIFCDVATGREIIAASVINHSAGYGRGRFSKLADGESVMAAQPGDGSQSNTRTRPWITHLHPTWSRDGKTVLFNVDETGEATQLFALDVDVALNESRENNRGL